MSIPEGQDGVTHINIYSQGETELGRRMSNWAACRIDLPEDGYFDSIEGYWYWLGNREVKMRGLVGYQAKKIGRELPRVYTMDEELFKIKIKIAMRVKVNSWPSFKKMLKESTLPFSHYYSYGGKKIDAGYQWIIEEWNNIRNELKEGE